MALSLAIQQHLEKVGLIEYFDAHQNEWKGMAKKSHDFIKRNFPADYDVHQEDVSKALITLIEVSDRMNDYLSANKLKEKYWMKYFCDYILDQCWEDIHKE
jgi:hypothetical protein